MEVVLLKPLATTRWVALRAHVNQDTLEMENLVPVRKLQCVYNIDLRTIWSITYLSMIRCFVTGTKRKRQSGSILFSDYSRLFIISTILFLSDVRYLIFTSVGSAPSLKTDINL